MPQAKIRAGNRDYEFISDHFLEPCIIPAPGSGRGTVYRRYHGNGHDTLFLCQMAGEKGKVLAFDIQEQALTATDRLLREHQLRDRASLYLESHVYMDRYVQKESADGIFFNFGYLPGGDHTLATRPDTSVEAVGKGLDLLKKEELWPFVSTAEEIRDMRNRTGSWNISGIWMRKNIWSL